MCLVLCLFPYLLGRTDYKLWSLGRSEWCMTDMSYLVNRSFLLCPASLEGISSYYLHVP